MELVYIGTADGRIIDEPAHDYASDYDPRKRPWYIEAIDNKGHVSITSPYISKSTNNIVVTVMQALPDDSGVIALDLNISLLSALTDQTRIGETGFASLLDNNKLYIAQKIRKAAQRQQKIMFQKFTKSRKVLLLKVTVIYALKQMKSQAGR